MIPFENKDEQSPSGSQPPEQPASIPRTEAVPISPATQISPAAPQTRKRRAMSFWIALILFFGLGISMLMNLGFMVAGVGGGAIPSAQSYQEKVYQGQGPDKIAMITLKGVIMDQGGSSFFPAPSIVKQTIKKLRQAAGDPDVKAVVLTVDSPGGGVTASDIIYNEVKKVKAQGKKVVVHMGDLCASGGYYVSAPADYIIASPTTITGSIGVILNTMDASELMEKKLGIKQRPIKSGKHKDILSISRPMSEQEQEILQSVIDSMYNRFLDIVEAGRKGKKNFPADRTGLKALADGRIFTGTQAVAVGLADDTGYLKEALDKANELAGLTDGKVITYKREPSLMDVLGGNVEGRGNVNINTGLQFDAHSLLRNMIPRFEYRWAPGNR